MQDCKIGYLPNGYFNQLETINNVLFTAREIDTIACVLHMRGSSKIASILDIAPRTAETHIVNIKRKIDNNSREGVIDFVERSGKFFLVRKHYQNLMIQADFNKKLKSLANSTLNNAPVCYFFCCNEKCRGSIIPIIQTHLKLTGIKLNICSISEELIEPKQEEHFIYVISNQVDDQYIILKALQEAKHKPSCFTFLVIEKINHNLSQKLAGTAYIDFSGSKNYYLMIFEIFKRLSPKISFDNIISQLECYQQSITDQQGLLKNYIDPSLEKSFVANVKLNKKDSHIKWIIAIFFELMIFAIWGYSKIMRKEPKVQKKEIGQYFLSTAIPKFAITSYMPEILTGYEHFIGRKTELQQIEQFLNQDNIVIITGQGGIGKSSCAIEYGKVLKRNQIVRYLNAESTTKIDQQYRDLAQELNIKVEKQPKNVIRQLVNNKLNTLSTEILFIFDNIDQYDDTKEYLINLPANIKAIITTRQPMLIANKPHIALAEFSNEEAVQYLKSSLQNRNFNKEFIHKLVKNIGNLPYDIKCMAAYLLDNPSVDNKLVTDEIGNKIKNKLFHEFIASDDPTKQQAWKILQYAANLDPDFISTNIIKELFPQNVELSSKALKKLESLSLISIINAQGDQAGFKVHRNLQQNVQNSAKYYFKHSIKRQKLTGNLLKVLDQLFPLVTHTPNIQRQIASSLQSHIEKLLNTEITLLAENSKINWATLHYKLAKYHLIVTVNYLKAFNHAKLSLDQMHVLYRDNHPEIANVYSIMGVVSRKLGNIAEGLTYSKKGLKIRQQIYLGDHADIADSLYSIGNAYNQNGELQQGLKFSQMALDMNRRLYSKPHPRVGYSLNLVGVCYIDLGNFEKSLEHFKSGLKIFTMLEPIDYEGSATLQSNIAYSYNELGNHVEALKYANASVEIFKKLYPDGHPRVIYSLDDFGESLIRANNIKRGLDVLHQALNMSKKFGMEKHCATAYVLHNLGWGHLKNKDYKTALEYAEKAFNLRKEMYGKIKNHPSLAKSLYNLGDIYCASLNKNKGLQLYQESMAMYKALSLEHLPEAGEIKKKIKDLDIQNSNI